ncbi:MAG: hypothetical protein ABIN80_02075 [Dyadobacter sp.]|uniref:hypothetical protein n=1 Tax=Dyadobacter sp. TaxID=1914288 RepID=UPI0032669298
MRKINFTAAFILSAVMIAFTAKSQSIVDPGVSVHNYKHPNKAAQAKAKNADNTIKVANFNTIERYGKQQRSRYSSSTPKYAPRPVALIVTRDYAVKGIDINPLVSPRNYKTPNNFVIKDTAQLADKSGIDSSPYPTVD